MKGITIDVPIFGQSIRRIAKRKMTDDKVIEVMTSYILSQASKEKQDLVSVFVPQFYEHLHKVTKEKEKLVLIRKESPLYRTKTREIQVENDKTILFTHPKKNLNERKTININIGLRIQRKTDTCKFLPFVAQCQRYVG